MLPVVLFLHCLCWRCHPWQPYQPGRRCHIYELACKEAVHRRKPLCDFYSVQDPDCRSRWTKHTYYDSQVLVQPETCFFLTSTGLQETIEPYLRCIASLGKCKVKQTCQAAAITNGTAIHCRLCQEGELDCDSGGQRERLLRWLECC